MIEEWLGTNVQELGLVAISGFAMVIWAIVTIRVTGLRSLSKMSGFDFVVTVALGSVVGGITSTSASLWHGATAFAALLGVQWTIVQFRQRSRLGTIVDNEPILLMEGPDIIEDNLTRARVTHHDLLAKLREANVTDREQVLAVVLETTGDVSVLHGHGPLDVALLGGVRRN